MLEPLKERFDASIIDNGFPDASELPRLKIVYDEDSKVAQLK